MGEIDVSGLLAQMRSLAAQAGSSPTPPVAPGTEPKTSFADVLGSSIDSVNSAQQRATELAAAFEAGTADVDLAEVMISLQKASLSFQAMTEVRNKLVNAYQEIMNMPV